MFSVLNKKFSFQTKQAILLYISTLIGVLLGVLSSIINTHYLVPSDYGDVRYVQNIISFIASLLLFGYFQSGSRLLALSDNPAYTGRIKGVMVIILSLSVIVLCLTVLLVSFFHHSNIPLFRLFLVSLPICAYPLLLNYVNTTAQGDNQIGRLSLARSLPVFVYVVISFFLYRSFGASSSLMMLLQWGIYTVVLFFIIISTKPSFHNLKEVWLELRTENKQYGIQLYIGSLVMVATNYLAGIFLGVFNSNNTEVGYYTLALTVASPLSTLPAIIGTTYFKEFATLPSIPKRLMKHTIILTIATCFCFVLLIKPLVVFLYSANYAPVGRYAAFLSVAFCIQGVGDMINRYLGSHGQGKAIRNSSIANGVFKVFGYTCLVYFFNTNGAIWTTIICNLIYLLSLIYYYRLFVKRNSLSNRLHIK